MKRFCAGGLAALSLLTGGVAHAQSGTVAVHATDAAPYVLSPDDQVNISVLGHADMDQTVTVLPDGTFRYPIVGSVHAAGMTVATLTHTLESGLAPQLNEPEVTVSVVQTRPRLVSVLGAMRAPGQYPVRVGEHLLDVFAAAGGPAQLPVLTQATLVTDNGAQSATVDVPGLLDGTDGDANILIAPGDVLLVQARDPSYAEAQVLGQVEKTGPIELPKEGLPIATVLAQMGGAAPDADMTHAQVLHGSEAVTVNLYPLLSDLNAPVGQTRLMPGDTLLVPENLAKIAILGDVGRPGQYPIPDGRSLTLLDALSQSGGAQNGADTKKASIVRKGPDGKPVVLPVDLAALMQGDPKLVGMTLHPDDVLYVPTRGSHQNIFQAIGSAIGMVSPLAWIAPYVH